VTALRELAEKIRYHAALKTREAHEIAAQAGAALAVVTDAVVPIVEPQP